MADFVKKIIIKSLVGSYAHGLQTASSDKDYRGIFIIPTSDILKLGGHSQQTSWVEGEIDDTAYELGKFLFMAMKSNATILEVLHSPVIEETVEGKELRELFPYMWTSKGVYDAFRGYSLNQRKKFLEDKDGRAFKYAVAYIRVLLLGIELLRNNTITVNVEEQAKLPCMEGATISSMPSNIFEPGGYEVVTNAQVLRGIKNASYSKGAIIDLAQYLEQVLTKAYEANPNHTNNINMLNDYLLKVRKANWEF